MQMQEIVGIVMQVHERWSFHMEKTQWESEYLNVWETCMCLDREVFQIEDSPCTSRCRVDEKIPEDRPEIVVTASFRSTVFHRIVCFVMCIVAFLHILVVGFDPSLCASA